MLVIRGLLIVIFALLAIMVVTDIWKSPSKNAELNWTVLTIFVSIVLVLGPLWPSKTNIQRWATTLDQRAGIPNVAAVFANVLGVAYSLYMIWYTYAHPGREFNRFEKPIVDLLGVNGLMVAWLLICGGCLIYGYRFYKKSKSSRPRPTL